MTLSTISELDPTDAALLLPILNQVHQLHVAAHPNIFRADTPLNELSEFLQAWLAEYHVDALVARSDDGTVLGYLIYEVQERSISALKKGSRIGFLHHIAVDEVHRGQRIGSRLIKELKLRLWQAGINRLGSEYFAFNAPSAALMRSEGLEPLRVTAEGET